MQTVLIWTRADFSRIVKEVELLMKNELIYKKILQM